MGSMGFILISVIYLVCANLVIVSSTSVPAEFRRTVGPDSSAALQSPQCQDNHANCQTWAASGECTKNPNYMNFFCKASCKSCVPDLPQVCQDKQVNCGTWATGGECQKNPYYMNVECKRACNLCTPAVCKDNNPSCPLWATNEECQKNPNYMNTECKISCNKCVVQ